MNRLLLVLAVALMGAAPSPAAPATVVLLVRHAERAPGSGDVPISDAGQARAQALAEVGKGAGVSAKSPRSCPAGRGGRQQPR